MTLIAGFLRNGCPILFGDILIADNIEANKELVFPTIGKISSDILKNGIYRPSAFRQKVNLLSPQLGLAWTGNLLEAKEFMAQVIGARLHNNPSREKIYEIYNDLEPKDLSIIGLLREANNIVSFDFGCTKVEVADLSFEWLSVGGTGYGALLDLIPKINSTIISGVANKLEYGISTAMEFVSRLLSLELQTGSTLHQMFGSGYEILHPLGNGLAKFSDLTYYFWNLEELSSGNWHVSFPFLAMKNSYHKDVLIVRSARLLKGDKEENPIKVESDELHIIDPIYRIVDNDELIGYSPLSLNSRFICNVFFCKKNTGEVGLFSSLGSYGNESCPIVWSNEFTLNEGLDISSKFLHEILNKVSSKFSLH